MKDRIKRTYSKVDKRLKIIILEGRVKSKHDVSMVYSEISQTSNISILDIRKNIFACLFSVLNAISLSRHEQVCLIRLRFERHFSHHCAT